MQPRNGTWSFDDHTTSTWIPSQQLGMPAPSREPATNFESSGWDDDEATRPLRPRDVAPARERAADFAMEWDEDESTTHTYNPAQHLRPPLVQNSNAEPARRVLQASPAPQRRKSTLPPASPVLSPPSRSISPATAALLRELEAEQPPARAAHPRVRPSPAARMTRQAELAAAVEQLHPSAARVASSGSRQPRRVAPQASHQQPDPAHRAEPRSGPVLKKPRAASAAPNTWEAPVSRPASRAQAALEASAAAPPRSRLSQLQPGAARSPTGNHRPIESAVRNNERAPRGRLQTHTRPVTAHRAPAPPTAEAHPPAPPQTQNPGFVYLVDDVRWHEAPATPIADPRTQPMQRPLRPARPLPNYAAVANQAPVPSYAPAPVPQPLAADLMPNARSRYELPALQPAPLASLDLDLPLEPGAARGAMRKLALQSAIPGLALFGAVFLARVLLSAPAAVQTAPAAVQIEPASPPAAAAPDAPAVPAPSAVAATPEAGEPPATAKAARSLRGKSRASDREPAQDVPPAESTAAPEVAAAEPASADLQEEPIETATPEPPSDAQDMGLLRLNSRPWSQVTIDGKPAGNTPLLGLRLTAGEHEIEMFNPAMDMRKKFQVRVVADEIVTRIVTLDE